jgi:anti-sigma regulatory factor (Ser/Thr protein kinase)
MVASFTVPSEIEAPALARHELRTQLEGAISDEEGRDLELLLSEVVTNAVRHSATTLLIAVRVEVDDRVIDVSVEDSGQGFVLPVAPQPRRDRDPQGFGLFLVDQISASWGVDSTSAFRVWFRLERNGTA